MKNRIEIKGFHASRLYNEEAKIDKPDYSLLAAVMLIVIFTPIIIHTFTT